MESQSGKVNRFLKHSGVQVPMICGAMYPCSNPELVAAASKAGALGIVQPLSLVYVHKYDFREGLKKIKLLSNGKPFGFNVLTEQSSQIYLDRMRRWVDIALEEGCRFFITALGNPRWIVERVKPLGGIVYHDVTEKKWAQKAIDAGVDGLICVNNRAGGHTGSRSPEELYEELATLNVPLVGAGGVGDPQTFKAMLAMGYEAVQMGTRFIASEECSAHDDYKQAILKSSSADIVLTRKLTGVPVSIIKTAAVEKEGTEAGPLAKALLSHPKFKHWMRLWYSIRSFRTLKNASQKGSRYLDYWQAGRSVDGIQKIQSVEEIVKTFY